MNLADLEKLREGRPGCPSDFALDRLAADELTGAAKAEAETHVAGCADCTARMAHRREGFAAYPGVDPRRMLANIRRAADERPTGALERWSRALKFLLAPLAVAGVAAVALLARNPGNEGDFEPTRAKGGPVLHVYRLVNGNSAEALSGDRFAPGEPIRFSVELADESAVAIVGVDAAGKLYRVWPAQKDSARLAAGKAELDGAVALDETPGAETFHLVACAPQAVPACSSEGARKAPACPAGCRSTPFVLEKGR